MVDDDVNDNSINDYVETVSRILSFAVNEPTLISKAEEILNPRPAHIYSNPEEANELNRYINRVFVDRYGRSTRLIIVGSGGKSEPEQLRTYHIDIANELSQAFHVARKSVCRTHMFYIGLECIRTRPEYLIEMTQEMANEYSPIVAASFWDYLEIATIRLVSFWDRVGQLLDFVFFNIRQYERDGFPVVLDRIKKNFAPTYPVLAADESFKNLVEYANSEKPDGFKWLTRRRNLTVHSTRFRPHEEMRDAMFNYEFNHYEVRVIRNLALKSPKEELELIHVHLKNAAELFRGLFDLAALGLDLIEQDVDSRRT